MGKMFYALLIDVICVNLVSAPGLMVGMLLRVYQEVHCMVLRLELTTTTEAAPENYRSKVG